MGLGPAIVAAALVLSQNTTTSSNADELARNFYQNGEVDYAGGRYAGAVDNYRRSFELSGRPGLLFNMANALEKDGRPAEAASVLSDYLPAARVLDRPLLEQRIAALQHRARIQQETARELAELRQFRIDATEELATLRPTPTRILPWVLGGLGVLAITAGVATGLSSNSLGNQAQERCSAGLCLTGAQGDLRGEKSRALAADILVALGAVSVGTGIGLWFFYSPPSQDAKVVAVGVQGAL